METSVFRKIATETLFFRIPQVNRWSTAGCYHRRKRRSRQQEAEGCVLITYQVDKLVNVWFQLRFLLKGSMSIAELRNICKLLQTFAMEMQLLMSVVLKKTKKGIRSRVFDVTYDCSVKVRVKNLLRHAARHVGKFQLWRHGHGENLVRISNHEGRRRWSLTPNHTIKSSFA